MADARVLIIEDDPDDALLTQRALGEWVSASRTMIVASAQRALDYLFAEGEFKGRDDRAQPDFIFLDLNLPDMSGIELLARIRADARTRLVPTVVLSGVDDLAGRLAVYLGGANSFLLKPGDGEAFTKLVARAGHYWLSVNRAVPVIRAGFLR